MGYRKVEEEEEAVKMRCCGFEMGGWVGGWETYSFDVPQLLLKVAAVGLDVVEHALEIVQGDACMGEVGGWVDGWLGELLYVHRWVEETKWRRRRRRRRRRTYVPISSSFLPVDLA